MPPAYHNRAAFVSAQTEQTTERIAAAPSRTYLPTGAHLARDLGAVVRADAAVRREDRAGRGRGRRDRRRRHRHRLLDRPGETDRSLAHGMARHRPGLAGAEKNR